MDCSYFCSRLNQFVDGELGYLEVAELQGHLSFCPDCAADGALDRLDRCSACGSTALVRRLGETTCRGCGAVDSAVPGEGFGVPGGADRSALEADVAAAIDRVLGGSDPGPAGAPPG